mmetsp:Transcript_37332/g.87083  ORF Transcript_37332/g.87083 Transcript_37332/m.87083 type:complete len:305 (-) Transcript_37332:176-1090(-)
MMKFLVYSISSVAAALLLKGTAVFSYSAFQGVGHSRSILAQDCRRNISFRKRTFSRINYTENTPCPPLPLNGFSCGPSSLSAHGNGNGPSDGAPPARQPSKTNDDSLIAEASYALRRLSWFSWWAQVILTTISSVTLVFSRGVRSSSLSSGSAYVGNAMFVLAGAGVVMSAASIIWTWGYCRLAKKFLRPATNRIVAANLLRRALSAGAFFNFFGIGATLIGAEQIIGVLFAKVLSAGGITNGLLVGSGSAASIGAQSIQPLDILIVQANTNTLLSHYIALACSFWLSRWIKLLDPPSSLDDPR